MPPHHTSAAIISIGDELTLGQALDTNSRWLSDHLMTLGIEPVEHATIPDDRAITATTFRRLAEKCPLVISTGGLGPTLDDLTREALADALNEPLVEDAAAMAALEERFRVRGRTLNALQRRQARRPETASCIPNPLGTAPGLHARLLVNASHRESDIYCLPGPPSELRPMFNDAVAPSLRPDPSHTIETRFVHLCGIGEGDAAARLGPLMDRDRNPLVGVTVSGGLVTVRIRATAGDGIDRAGVPDEPTPASRTAAEVRERLGPYVFGEADDTLAASVLRILRERKETLAVAESCTGGMLGELITQISGASAAFLGGFVTYSNELKQSLLGVDPQLLAAHGAVSEDAAAAMAAGCLTWTCARHSLAITGIAGPGGATPGKPVGTVFISRATAHYDGPEPDIDARRFLISGDRDDIRTRAATTALAMLFLSLKQQTAVPLLWQV